MSTIDRITLPLPSWAVPSQPRRIAVDDHTIHIREQWWREAINTRGLPGTPPAASTLHAYELMRPHHRTEIRSLGPSFFTKFLYFAGGGAPDHPCLILDGVVATTLHDHCGWPSLHRSGPWSPEIYGQYCNLLDGGLNPSTARPTSWNAPSSTVRRTNARNHHRSGTVRTSMVHY